MSHRGGCAALRQLKPSWVKHPKDLRVVKNHTITVSPLTNLKTFFLVPLNSCHYSSEYIAFVTWQEKKTKLEELFHFLLHSKLLYPKTTSS